MRPLDVLVATKDGRKPGGLEHLGDHQVLMNRIPGWVNAANYLLDDSARSGHDALFIDDDVTLTSSTFDLLDKYWDKAEVFGFTLVPPNDQRVLSAGVEWRYETDGRTIEKTLQCQKPPGIFIPSYVPHVTASCMVVKKEVLRAGVRFPVWPGMHLEDVAFTLECWLKGFRVAYLPGLAYHDAVAEGGVTVGATKRHDPEFHARRRLNQQHLIEWTAEHGVDKALEAGEMPFFGRPIA